MENATGTVWFWCDDDYAGRGDSAFTWDELERQSLEGADDETVGPVASFWRRHRPVVMSVEDGYAYLAIVVSGPDRGQVVTGREPMHEETEVVCGSFDELMTRSCTGLPIPLVRSAGMAGPERRLVGSRAGSGWRRPPTCWGEWRVL